MSAGSPPPTPCVLLFYLIGLSREPYYSVTRPSSRRAVLQITAFIRVHPRHTISVYLRSSVANQTITPSSPLASPRFSTLELALEEIRRRLVGCDPVSVEQEAMDLVGEDELLEFDALLGQ